MAERVLAGLLVVPFLLGAAVAPSDQAQVVFSFRDSDIVESSGLVVVDGLVVRGDRMAENIERGLGLHASSRLLTALVEQGGLSREDFGRIDIKPAFSIVELPADLPAATVQALADTRISGVLIELKPDRFARNRGADRGPRSTGATRTPSDGKKPRHKKRGS